MEKIVNYHFGGVKRVCKISSCETHEKEYFDWSLECVAPKCCLKYTRYNVLDFKCFCTAQEL